MTHSDPLSYFFQRWVRDVSSLNLLLLERNLDSIRLSLLEDLSFQIESSSLSFSQYLKLVADVELQTAELAVLISQFATEGNE